MDTASAILALGLAAVFAVSGVAKLRTLADAAATLDALRLPAPAPRALVGALAVGELSLAIGLLLPPPLLLIAAIGTVALCAVFLIVVVRAHRLGSTDSCGCFGTADETPIGTALVVRNSVLLTVAVLLLGLVAAGARGVPAVAAAASADATTALPLLAAAALVALAVVIVRAHTPAAVAPAPSAPGLTEAAPDGDTAASTPTMPTSMHLYELSTKRMVDYRARAFGRAQLLVFIKPGCGSCTATTSYLDEHADALGRVVDVTVAAASDTLDELDGMLGAAPQLTALDLASRTGASLGVGNRRPLAALIATDGSIVEPLALDAGEIAELIDVLVAAAGEAEATSDAP